MKKKLALILAATMTVGLLASCGGSGSGSASKPEAPAPLPLPLRLPI